MWLIQTTVLINFIKNYILITTRGQSLNTKNTLNQTETIHTSRKSESKGCDSELVHAHPWRKWPARRMQPKMARACAVHRSIRTPSGARKTLQSHCQPPFICCIHCTIRRPGTDTLSLALQQVRNLGMWCGRSHLVAIIIIYFRTCEQSGTSTEIQYSLRLLEVMAGLVVSKRGRHQLVPAQQ